jgi:hypothetical protein
MRRNDINEMVPSELALYKAMVELEKFTVNDVRLTQASVMLQQVKNLISDVVDEWQEGGPG